MDGWKTKLGGALVGIAGVITAVKGVLPPEIATYAPWFEFAQALLAAAGAAFLGVGIGHKIEKAAAKKTCETCGKNLTT